MEKNDIEQIHFNKVMKTVENEILKSKKSLEQNSSDFSDMLEYASESFYTMDEEEIAVTSTMISKLETELEEKKTKIQRLTKVEKNPYFGKIDFTVQDTNKKQSVYVGLSNVSDEREFMPLVCDWRAPVSSMFYDFELGKSSYHACGEEIFGEITAKRQFKIQDKKLEFYFDSSLTIMDDILKDTLAKNADDKMRNIVSTIQKEQNKIIRKENSKNLLVQGVAGSGKTSIALHRVAYLLYSIKNLSASDILILSPNSFFSEYISQVLPELGENNIVSITFFDIAKKELENFARVEDRSCMLDKVLSEKSKRLEEVQTKASFDFFENLKTFLSQNVDLSFTAKDVKIGEKTFSCDEIEKLYSVRYSGKKPSLKIDWICDYILDELHLDIDKNILVPRIKRILQSMFKENNILEIYDKFLQTQNMTFTFNSKQLRNEDVAPILFIKDYLIGFSSVFEIKYLLIDEMQDYSPIQFELVNKIFSCRKIVLGDINQCLEKKLDQKYLSKTIQMFDDCEFIELKKSYRSTIQISKFANKIISSNAEFVDRSGDEVGFFDCENFENQIEKVSELVTNQLNDFNKVAIICKTKTEAEKFYEDLKNKIDCSLGLEINNKKCYVISATDSKGIEFDCVIVPNADEKNYYDETDRNVLYVSSTRALHKLSFCFVGEKTKLI